MSCPCVPFDAFVLVTEPLVGDHDPGIPFLGIEKRVGGRAVKCPVCRVPGFVVEYADIELDVCAECSGIWFDGGELELVLGGKPALSAAAADTDEALRPCPICDKKMDKVNIGPGQRVLIDSCPAGCGLWFDAGELSRLTRDLTEEGWAVARPLREFLFEMFSQKDPEDSGL